MKNYSLLLLLAALTGCGQIGPLYLPDTLVPPVYVPKPEPEKPKAEQTTPSKTEPEKAK